MDAAHFRKRAAEARAMAELGEDPKLSWLLLEVAQDLDAEADMIEAGSSEWRSSQRLSCGGMPATLRSPIAGGCVWHLPLTDLSIGGARLAGDPNVAPGRLVILELPSCELRMTGRVVPAEPGCIAVEFIADPETTQSTVQALQLIAGNASKSVAAGY